MEKIWNSLQDNDVVKGIVSSKISCGNLFLMEEALLLVSSFKKEPKNYIVVKKSMYEAQQLYKRVSPLMDEVLLFVMEESLRVQAIASSPEDKDEMIYSLTQLIKDNKPKIIICNVAAFTRYLPHPV